MTEKRPHLDVAQNTPTNLLTEKMKKAAVLIVNTVVVQTICLRPLGLLAMGAIVRNLNLGAVQTT